MRVALIQTNPTVGDFVNNASKIASAITRASQAGANLIVFPELALSGYPPLDLLERPEFDRRSAEGEAIISRAVGPNVCVVVGNVRKRTPPPQFGKPFENQAVCIRGGRVTKRVTKTCLPTFDVFDEARYYAEKPGTEESIIDVAGEKVGVSICADLWNGDEIWENDDLCRGEPPTFRQYARDPIQDTMDSGTGFLLNLSASPWSAGKLERRKKLLETTAKKYGAFCFYINLVGANDGLIFDGQSLVYNPAGALCHQGRAFEEDFVLFDTETSAPRKMPSRDPNHDIHDALVLGIHDYFRKTGLKKAVIGLSGGIDSAVTAALATKALGKENVVGVLLPSRFSSDHSLEDAASLAENLGIQTHTLSIEPANETLLSTLAETFEGQAPDVTEENIQSRLRGLLLMALANKSGGAVLCTGNKSEVAMGYCTLYGDTIGALSVLADLYKNQVYALASFVNRESIQIPLSSINKAPSAELKPGQKDEDSLPPYEILDRIVELFVEDRKTSTDIAEQLNIPHELAESTTKTIYQNEFKRKQMPPVLRVSPKAWLGRQYPIAHRF